MKSLPFLLLSVALSYGFPIFPEKRTEEQNMQLAQMASTRRKLCIVAAAVADIGSNETKVKEYLDQFYEQGNDPKQQAWKSSNSLEDKIKQMQAFFELNVTGEIDAATLQVMQQPRCGVPDIGQFVLALPGWQKTKLTYRIVNYTPDMKQADVDAAIQKACEVWSSVTPLTFRRVYQGKADITIVFTSGVHGRCPRQFDGPLGVLGHAFPPSHFLRGSVHLDEDETWSAGLVGFNLYLVATHEIGHALGLAHSADPEALMYPNYKPIDPNEFPLSQDDITGIQTIYGPSHDPSKKPTKPKEPKACDPKISFDAVTTLRGETIFIKDRHLWRVYRSSPEVDLELILAFWPFLPSGIQAAYENMKNQVLFFKDNLFWMTSDFRLQPGYPQTIDNFGFPPNVKKIDAAGFDQNTGKTFFFVGDQYWRYDENSQSMDKNYPRKVREDFPGIGKKVDAVFQRNGFFYFFHGSKQWEFDWNAKKVTRVMKSNSWFNC